MQARQVELIEETQQKKIERDLRGAGDILYGYLVGNLFLICIY
jgi:hypothetical protein